METHEKQQTEFTNFPPATRIADGLAKVAKVLRQQAWGEAWNKGLTPAQGQMLLTLLRHPDHRLTLQALAAELGVNRVTACLTIQVLARKKLVRKERRKRVLDKLYVRLTRKGRDEAEHASRWSDFLVPVIEMLPRAQQVELHRALVRLILALQERKEIAVNRMCVTCRFFRPYVHENLDAPHHCELVDAPFGDGQIRLSCPDHQQAANLIQLDRWRAAHQ